MITSSRSALVAMALAALLCTLALPSMAVDTSKIYNNSLALLIGINEYTKLPKSNWLSYSVNDVVELKKTLLESYGFPAENITVLTDADATKANIEKALSAFADSDRVKKEDRILIYFSGHGQTVKTSSGGEMGFLLPYDAEVKLSDMENAGPFMSTCLPMSRVWEYLQPCPAKHVLILADVCYSGMLAQSRALEEVSLAAVEVLAKTPARQVITAGGKGQKSIEKSEWGHGAFTYKLLEKLRARTAQPGKVFTTQELFAEVQKGVGNVTEGRQTPQLYSRETEGEFLFIPDGEPEATGAAIPPKNMKPAKTTKTSVAVKPVEEEPAAEPAVEEVSTTARIKVTSKPSGAQVVINGVPESETTPCEIEVDLGASKSKKIEVAVKLDGYKDAVYSVTAARGKTASVDAKLTASPASTEAAGSEISPEPEKPAATAGKTKMKDLSYLSFSYPDSWRLVMPGDPGSEMMGAAKMALMGPTKDGFAANINLTAEIVGAMTAADYLEISEANAPLVLPSFKVVSHADVKVGAIAGREMVYTATNPMMSQPMKFKGIAAVRGGTAYMFTYTNVESNYGDHVKVLEALVKSVKWGE